MRAGQLQMIRELAVHADHPITRDELIEKFRPCHRRPLRPESLTHRTAHCAVDFQRIRAFDRDDSRWSTVAELCDF